MFFTKVSSLPRIILQSTTRKETQVLFLYHDETIKHFFFLCGFACSIWSIVNVAASNLYPLRSVANIFSQLVVRPSQIRVGVVALI
jgi:hypothetical protein